MEFFRSLGERFEAPWKLDEGGYILGRMITDGGSSLSPNEFAEARQFLRTPVTTPYDEVGKTTLGPDGYRYLLAQHQRTNSYRSYRIFRVNDYLPWQKPVTVIDPLTQLPRFTGLTEPIMIYCVREAKSSQVSDSNLRVSENSFRILTGMPVEEGNTLGGMRVTSIRKQMGISILEVQ